MSVWRARLDGVNEQDRRYAYKAWSRSEDVRGENSFRPLLGSRQTGYPNRKAQTEWPGCKSRGNVYDKRRHKEIGRRREEGEENHSNPNAQVTDECM